MLFEKIESKGLAHYSYIIGDAGKVVVIDPRRDIDIYLQKASEEGYQITTVLETHRNEDYLIGSVELAKKTGAEVYHADKHLNYRYGKAVEEGQVFKIGSLKLEAMHTPGHTPGSFSYLLYGYEGEPWMIFSGDALFAGDVGRVDFLGEENLAKTAGQLYDSIYNKILSKGDEVILFPAHGSGSVCASQIAERELTTCGLEKKLNPRLQYQDKEEFIKEVGEMLEYPPYFKKMEKCNLEGAPLLAENKTVAPLTADEFSREINKDNVVVIDTREEIAYAAAHIPGSIYIWKEILPAFAGWFIDTEQEILIVNYGEYPEDEIKYLNRIGFDKIKGYLAGGMVNWHKAGKKSYSINTLIAEKFISTREKTDDSILLDIRSEEDIENEGAIDGALNIHLTQLPENLDRIPRGKDIFILCPSGIRSMVVASILKNNGFAKAQVVLGGLSALEAVK